MEPTTLVQLDDEELYFLLGKEVLKGEQNFSFLSRKQIIEKARVWFRLNLPVFQNKVCQNAAVREAYEKQDAGNIVAGIIDLIAGALTGIAPATVAYLLYRQGIKLLCKTQWGIKA